MQDLLAIFADVADEDDAEYAATSRAFVRALRDAGAFIDARGLHPAATATTLRVRGGQRQVEDGPAQPAALGAWVVLEAASAHEALEWAARCPAAARGTIEVRPIIETAATERT